MENFESQQFRNELAKKIKEAPKEERKDILKKAREEAWHTPELIQEAPLSPETIEKIMEKVQDINTAGTAFHVWHGESIDQIQYPLQDGILGLHHKKVGPELRRTQWKQTMKEEPKLVFFNIMGRKASYLGESRILQKMDNTAWISEYQSKISIAFIFDLTGYEEIAPTENITDTMNSRLFPRKSFSVHNFMSDWKELFGEHAPGSAEVAAHYAKGHGNIDATGRPIAISDYGFVLPNRIAPRAFQGIVLQQRKIERKTSRDIAQELSYKFALAIAGIASTYDGMDYNIENLMSREIVEKISDEWDNRSKDHQDEEPLKELFINLLKKYKVANSFNIKFSQGNSKSSITDKEKMRVFFNKWRELTELKIDPDKIAGVDRDFETNQKTALQIAQTMKHVNQGHVERILPIYNIDGNLLWPKQMSYEEVKQLVTERDKDKAQK
ncbi:MAG: hypothetical protein AAB875_04760 [Patescibacteria group bacterium]